MTVILHIVPFMKKARNKAELHLFAQELLMEDSCSFLALQIRHLQLNQTHVLFLQTSIKIGFKI